MRFFRPDTLKPIPTPHPLITLGSLAIIGVMIYWGLVTNLREPQPWVGTTVLLFVIFANVVSRRSRT
jgi:hypothetical protein